MTDIWSEWLKYSRFGGDNSYKVMAMSFLKKLALKIVEKAEVFESAVVLDIGSGDGIIGITALEALGINGKLILSDISEAALSIPKVIFNDAKNFDPRVEFLVANVTDLSAIPSNSIDRVLLRAVLLYVENKQAAFNEIFRILRPNGVAVLMEPVNQRHVEFGKGFFRGYSLDKEPLLSIKSLIQKVSEEIIKKNPSFLIDYNEHDLVHFSINSGFEEIKLDYTFLRTANAKHSSWDAFYNTVPNPHASSLQDSLKSSLNQKEFEIVESILKKVYQQPGVLVNSEALLILRK